MIATVLTVTGAQAIPSRAAAPIPSRHAYPGSLVAVDRSSGTQPSIWTIVPGTSRATRIAHARVPLIAPDVSPNGDRIAFNRDADYRYTDARDKLVLTRLDGSDPQVIRQACMDDCHWFDDLAWAPDGQTILMWRCVGDCPRSGYRSSYAIWSIRTDGTELRQLTLPGPYTHTSKLNDHSPEASPDGTEFVFVRFDDVTGGSTLQIAPIDGGPPVAIPLPDDLSPGDPIWTPDGSRILFQSPYDLLNDEAINLYTVAPDGTDLQQITHYHVPQGQHFGGVFHASFSPDGRYIAATHMFSPHGFSYVILSPDGALIERIPLGPNLVDMEWGST
jgi:Tol biopolymer transport system component